MTKFISSLAPRMEAFLELKRAMGRRYEAAEGELRRFDRYVAELDEPTEVVSRALVHAWLAARPSVRAATQRSRVGALRQFCLYLARSDARTYVPERAFFAPSEPSPKSHVFSREEIHQLFRAVPVVVSDRFKLQRETVKTMLLVLYLTGLRVGEASRLRIGDVDLDALTFFVHETKFLKSRLVPFSEDLADELRAYLALRSARWPTGAHRPFFVNRSGRVFATHKLSTIFHDLVDTVGVPRRSNVRGPCLHDLRRTFAVHRVVRWYRDGADVQAKLPLLATYMGHGNVLSTHVYLTATVDLLQEASGRFERSFGSLVTFQEEACHEVP